MIYECERCSALVDGKFIASHECDDPEGGPPERYTLLACPNCNQPALVFQNNYTGNEADWDSPYRLYPVQKGRLNYSVPVPIRNAYAEAQACLKAKAYTAAAIMCRKTLEAICIEHGAAERNLVASLKNMKEKGVIESRLYDWADALRISGNEAAHDVAITIKAEDAIDIIEFTNALIEYVFTFRDKFEDFKKRKSDKKSG